MLRSALRLLLASTALLSLALATGASAATSGPPLALTSLASRVSATNATLAATVDPQGLDTSVQFEWGTTTAYGQTTPAVPATVPALVDNAPTGNTRVKSAPIPLTPGTTYHFRVVATNAQGTTTGADRAFVAQDGVMPGVVTGPPTLDHAFTKVTLAGTVNPRGQETVYKFHIALNEADLGTNAPPAAMMTPSRPAADQPPLIGTADVQVTQAYPASRSQPALEPGKTYYYRLVATNASGSTRGPVKSFFTGTVVPPPPPPPAKRPPGAATLPATGITSQGVTLKGLVNPAGQGTTYRFEYGPTAAYGATTAPLAAGSGLATVPATATVAGLRPGTVYHYRLVATNGTGTGRGADMTFATTGTSSPTGTVASVSNPGPVIRTRARLRLLRLRAVPNRVSVMLPRGCTSARAMRTTRCRRAAARLAIRVRFTVPKRARITFTIRRGARGRALGTLLRTARSGANSLRLPVVVRGRPLTRGLYTITAVAGRGALASVPVRVRIAVRTGVRTR